MANSQAANHDNWLVRCSLTLQDLAKAISITTFWVWKNNIRKGGLKVFLKRDQRRGRGLFVKWRGGGGGVKYPLQTISKFWR